MSSIKSKDTKPELLLRKSLWSKGFRYRVNMKGLPGTPDIVFTRVKIAVFCDGDFWHGHNWALRGFSNLEEELNTYTNFWKEKIMNNVARDKQCDILLEEAGWCVLRFWESEIKNDTEVCVERIISQYKERNL